MAFFEIERDYSENCTRHSTNLAKFLKYLLATLHWETDGILIYHVQYILARQVFKGNASLQNASDIAVQSKSIQLDTLYSLQNKLLHKDPYLFKEHEHTCVCVCFKGDQLDESPNGS
jgi:hypothetical protein